MRANHPALVGRRARAETAGAITLRISHKRLAQEVAEKRIRVNSIASGAIRASINAAAQHSQLAIGEDNFEFVLIRSHF